MCPDVQQPFPHRGANGSSVDTVDYADDDSASVLALRRRRGRRQDTPEEEEEKISRLINEITRSIDQIPSSSSNFIDVMDDHYEVRQVQQQFTIEVALPQPAHKHKVPYGRFVVVTLVHPHLCFQMLSTGVRRWARKVRWNVPPSWRPSRSSSSSAYPCRCSSSIARATSNTCSESTGRDPSPDSSTEANRRTQESEVTRVRAATTWDVDRSNASTKVSSSATSNRYLPIGDNTSDSELFVIVTRSAVEHDRSFVCPSKIHRERKSGSEI